MSSTVEQSHGSRQPLHGGRSGPDPKAERGLEDNSGTLGEKDHTAPSVSPTKRTISGQHEGGVLKEGGTIIWACMRRYVTAGSGSRETRTERARATAARGSASQLGMRRDARYAAERWARRLRDNEACVYVSRSLAGARSSWLGHCGPPNLAGSERRALEL